MTAVRESTLSSLMVEHISIAKIEAFRANALKTTEMVGIVEHLISCAECERRLRDVIKDERDYRPVSISMEFEDWFRHDHLDYEQLVAYVDEKLDAEETEFTNLHLEFCERCSGDVRSFLEFRSRLEEELSYRHAPTQQQTQKEKIHSRFWRPVIAWRPLYVGAVLTIIGLAVSFAILRASRRPDDQSRQDTYPPRTVTVSPSPSVIPVPSQSPALVEITPSPPKTTAKSAINRRPLSLQGTAPRSEIAVLKDGGKEVRINKSGIIGAGMLPSDLQRVIKETLLAENIKKPAVLDEVNSEQGPLRGNESGKSRFRLLSPVRTVISEQQPTFKWEPLEGVSGYEVIVGDSFGRRSANSGQLPANATQWRSASTLKRGEVYSWVVKATINGEKIITPVPPDREMKFKVLDEKSARRLEALKKTTSSHLVLGMYYAREGMIEEAEREFQQLLNANPNSPIATALLRSVQSWR
jgi:hypothetical protein